MTIPKNTFWSTGQNFMKRWSKNRTSKSSSTKKSKGAIEKPVKVAVTTDVTNETTAAAEEANAVLHLDEI